MNLMTIKKTISPVAVAAALAAALATAGTAAYLTATSYDVNAFAMGRVQISLTEADTGLDGDGNDLTNTYEIARAGDGSWDVISKDPTVTVAAGSPDCWVFVTLGESDNFGDLLSYQTAEGWARLMTEPDAGGFSEPVTTAGGAEVWYREVLRSDEKQIIHVLAGSGIATDGVVTVDADVIDAQVRALGTGDNPNPTLTITACAVQMAGVPTALDAWELAGN